MAARTAWTGAVNFGGFPIHLAAYNATTSKSADSFKSLCPCHKQAIKQVKTCAVTGDTLANDALLKGAEMSKTMYVLDDRAIEALKEGESTKELEVERFAPLDSIPLWLADKAFRFTADPKVPGSTQSANVLWNGLRASGRAAVIDGWIQKASSRPSLLVIYAEENGALTGLTLPYMTALADTPNGGFTEDEKAAAMFEAFVDAQDYTTDAFEHSAYVDLYRERRDEMVARAIKGEPIAPTITEDKKAPKGPDLMAAMQAALASTPKAGAKKPAAKKKLAKAKA